MEPLSRIWAGIQRTLLPFLREELGPLDERLQRLVALLEVIRIEDFVPAPAQGYRGRPADDRRPLARAFVAKAVLNHPTTRGLIEDLERSAPLRRLCGWEHHQEIPSESTFSRAFAEFAASALGQRVHEALIQKFESPRLVGHLSRDATAIEAREKAAPQRPVERAPAAPPVPAKKRGRPRKEEVRPPPDPTRLQRQAADMAAGTPPEALLAEIAKDCDWGCKRNSQGKVEWWKGYKLHLDWADGMIPISVVLTAASVHDSQVAIPLAQKSAQRVRSLYDRMDAAYDAQAIRTVCATLNHIPLIDGNPRRGGKIPFAPAEAERFKERTNAERGNGRLKDEFGGRFVRVRGHAKVLCHMMFGVLALTADQLLRFVTA